MSDYPKTIFVDDNNHAIFICPNCKKSKIVDVSDFLKPDAPARIKYKFKCGKCECGTIECKTCKVKDCSLGHTNTVFLEKRKFGRKKVNLSGSVVMGKEQTRKVITIRDLSRGGLRFSVHDRLDFSVDGRVTVTFRLDDRKKTFIVKEVVIKNIRNNDIGAEFYSITDDIYDKAIGLYLFGMALPLWSAPVEQAEMTASKSE